MKEAAISKRIVIFLILAGMLAISIFAIARANNPLFVEPLVKQTTEAIQTELHATRTLMPEATIDLRPTATELASCPVPTPYILGIVSPRDMQMPFGDHRGITSQTNAVSPAGYIYIIWAGAPEDKPDQGFIRVMKIVIDTCASHRHGIMNTDTTMTDYRAPKGPLTITKIEGEIIVYNIAGGGTGRFNIVTGQFLP